MGVAIKLPLFGRRPEEKRKRKPGKRPVKKQEASAQAKRKPRQAPAKGATRKQQAQAEKSPANFAWLNRLLIIVGIGVVSAAGLQAWIFLAAIPVERISVTGELANTRTTAVQDMVQPALVGGFLGTDLAEVRGQLEALPWIYEANVRRVWPNALEIHVVEQLPIARWGDGGFLNHQGEVFRPSDSEAWGSLPQLRGPEGAAGELMRTYQRLVDILTPLRLSVTQLVVDERGQVEAVLSGGQSLMIGGGEFRERMQRFSRLYRAELVSRMDEVQRVDLRYRKGVAVAYREPVAPEPPTDNEKA
ncbi:hypothetical protein A3709_14480 [Halioglobus sp. HI00S01]|uniref:cell division protein FtsQ/DivIB n=1 Tax=Halioglobus sp. HI00S01 TaxID=1822214 RepID=UPI0007C3E7ED|nr:cell division protein FtsQ/DivIB [Halioglobus sp. HI00S01]KZX59496.1 hypothetical protein A3709_14480 [Halioglobus sp. HI00S01]